MNDTTPVAPLHPYAEKGVLRDNIEVVFFALVIIFFYKTFVAQQFKVPTGSMRETVMIGDHLVINKFIFARPQFALEEKIAPMRSVQRGDIVTFRWPIDRDQDYVKRCVALPGDWVEIKNKRLYVNDRQVTGVFEYHIPESTMNPDPATGVTSESGAVVAGPWPLDRNAGVSESSGGIWPFADPETVALNRHGMPSLIQSGFRDELPRVKVPTGHILALGDDRDNSLDSRYWGFVPLDHLRGRPFLVWWSFREGQFDHQSGRVPSGPLDILQDALDTVRYFFIRTRWERTGYIPK